MGKPTKKKAGKRTSVSLAEQTARLEEQDLRRSVARQKRVRALARALMAMTAAADRELRYVLRMAAQRLEPGKSAESNGNTTLR